MVVGVRPPKNAACCGVTCDRAEGKSQRRSIEILQAVISNVAGWRDAGKSGLVPPRNFVRKIKIGFIFLDRPAKRRARLHARVSRIWHSAEGIHRLKITVAQISKHVAVKIVRSRARDDVHHPAGSAAILRRVVVGDDLKFLHRLLRHRRANSVYAVIGRVGAVHVHQIRARPLPADVQSRGWRRAGVRRVVALHLGIGQREVNVVAAVDGQDCRCAAARSYRSSMCEKSQSNPPARSLPRLPCR